MKTGVFIVHNVYEKQQHLASVWILMPEYFEKSRDCPPWGESNKDEVPHATRIVGPIETSVALKVFENLVKALRLIGLEVVADETADD